MKGVLSGIRVLDFGRFISGPFSAMLLADMGAEVIKIEKPGGNTDRALGPYTANGNSMYASVFSRNKKCITINYRTEEGKEILKKLICTADVIIDNFRPGVMKKMGFSYEDIIQYKPDIIMASVSGFGQEGEYANRAAFDGIATAMAGAMCFNNLPGYGPRGLGTPVADISTGYVNALSIMMALFHREKTGEGQFIDTAMVDCCVPLLETQITFYSLSGSHDTYPKALTRKGGDPMTAPANTFKAKDGYFYMHAGTDSLFSVFAQLANDPELLSEPYKQLTYRVEHADRVEELAANWIATLTVEEAERIIGGAGIPCAIINTVDRIVESDYAKSRKQVVSIDMPGVGPVSYLGNPIKLSKCPVEIFAPGQEPGQSNHEIYCDLLGYSEKEYQEFMEKKLI